MPKKIEARLRRYAAKKRLHGAEANRYVYGGITNITKKKNAKRRGKRR